MENATAVQIPALNQYWEGQGGIYVGPSVLGGHLIAAAKQLDGKYQYGGYGDRLEGYSDVDGRENTDKLIARGNHPAAVAARSFEQDGHTDFYLPSHREILQLLAVEGFNEDGDYTLTSTPYGSYDAWAVDFEDGGVRIISRFSEFRVRPFRRFTH